MLKCEGTCLRTGKVRGETQRRLHSGVCGTAAGAPRTGGRAGPCRGGKSRGSQGAPESGHIPVAWERVSGKASKAVGDFKNMVDEPRFKAVLRRIDHLSLLSRYFRSLGKHL